MIFEVNEKNINLIVKDWKREAKKIAADTIDEAIREPRQWSATFGTTYRQNKEIVKGSFRNIFDLGNFATSWDLEWLGDKLQFTSDSPYSSYIILGFVSKSGRVVRGRIPWERLMDELREGDLIR